LNVSRPDLEGDHLLNAGRLPHAEVTHPDAKTAAV
jgi:hypothetical protein